MAATYQLTSSRLATKATCSNNKISRELRLLIRDRAYMESLMLINNKMVLSLGAAVLGLRTPKIINTYTR